MSRIITISVKAARLKFIECGPICIANDCTARCCDAKTSPLGIKVTILPDEVKQIEQKGFVVIDGYLQPRKDERLCPFKTEGHLCNLHGTKFKPFGCIVSPFMLTKNNSLVIRNRYKMLPCYDKEHGQPAYKVFRSSLVEIFGEGRTNSITKVLDWGKRNLSVTITDDVYKKLTTREAILK